MRRSVVAVTQTDASAASTPSGTQRARRSHGWTSTGRLLLAYLAIAAPQSAAAFCRESLATQSQGRCDEAPGVPFLFWQRWCVMYRFNARLFSRLPLMSETAVRSAFRKGFDAWADVSCEDKRSFLVQQGHAVTATERSELLLDAPNESVVNARLAPEWLDIPDHDPDAIALTMLWFDHRNGEILDVDMELNLGAGDFVDCLQQSCGAGQVDLQNTVTHEAGHLLGLGHSHELHSTMDANSYTQWETDKRHLSEDDRLGYCALNLPEPMCATDACSCPQTEALERRVSSSPLQGGCQASTRSAGAQPSRSHPATLFGLLVWCVLFVAGRARRRRRG